MFVYDKIGLYMIVLSIVVVILANTWAKKK